MSYTTPDFSQTHVLVVGDVMLDRYWYGDTQRISPEAPVPVVRVKSLQEQAGGAGNVALNIAALGGQVTLIGLCGEDENADRLQEKLTAAKINCQLIRVSEKPTISKLRVMSLHQQLIRLDFEEYFHEIEKTTLYKLCEEHSSNVTAVILSDYGKGTLNQCQALIQMFRKKNISVLVDPKGRDFSIYTGANILTPNRKEFEEVVGDCPDENTFKEKGLELITQLNLSALLVTRGAQGMTLLRENESEFHLPAHAREIFDVTGAGDTVIAVLGLALAVGCDIETATYFANHAAGLVVGKLGAATVSVPELRQAIYSGQPTLGVVSEEQLLVNVENAKIRGEKIVMTNGCFDILHAGHVTYLEEAKKLGHRLVVAVNDDQSVERLKGVGRPLNPLERRMAVLAGLSSVDWVVSFGEDTPARIIEKVLPDVLVKGGDYQVSQLAGADSVLKNGGEVKILSFVPGCSTTSLVNQIKEEVVT
ncbi:MAG: bifunctional D-glycero-beta-D-manno-heptose-7-phosphate kinase/D-glycero-beta-D-manno-heptose 1-phosphate adenylyltransferase HldE [Gammaproteobacteria bacterium]